MRTTVLPLAVALAVAACSSPRSGYVFLTQQRLDAPPLSSAFELSASFYDIGVPDFEAGTVPGLDVTDAEGGCLLTLDPEPGASFDGGRVAASVGAAELVGGDEVAGLYFENASEMSFDPGTPVTLTVAGSDAVAAAEVTLTAPAPSGVTLPSAVPREEDLTITWSPDLDADVVELRLDAILCNVPASDGSLTVSRRLLAQLPLADDRILQVIAYRSRQEDVGGLPVIFRVGDVVGDRVTLE